MTYGNEKIRGEKFWQAGVLLALIALFFAMSQPYWRGDDMLAEMKANCDQIGGTMIDTKGVLGTTYKCVERLDK